MNDRLKTPPRSPYLLTTPGALVKNLSELIGRPFSITGKPRTDGSNIRKLVALTLEKYFLPNTAAKGEYEIVPPKGKGIPRICLEFIDTYIVTTGISYNLQVWNRIPASNTLLIKYETGESLLCNDVRFVLVRVDIEKMIIASIFILTPGYIEKRFGNFGNPTVKYQLLISAEARASIINGNGKILFYPDSKKVSYYAKHEFTPPGTGMMEEPKAGEIYSVEVLKKIVAEKLIGYKLDASSTKNRGQSLERKVLDLLQYKITDNDLLHGGFPDIRNQLLEVKVQDTPTVDLGRFSPEKEDIVFAGKNFTTFDVRYLIALTNAKTEVIDGIILAPGEKLGELFSYVSDHSYKCQRAIPMSFFDNYYGQSVFNPD